MFDCCDHTPCPKGYLEWHEWAEKMQETHDQIQCPECGLYEIWIPKELNDAINAEFL